MSTEPKSSLNAAAPAPLRLLLDVIERLGRLDGWLGALCLVLMTLLILAEVLVRALSRVLPFIPGHIPVAWEYGSYLMAATFTFGAAMTLRAGGHIRVNLLLTNASPGFKRLLEVVASGIGFAFTAFLAFAMLRFALASLERGTTAISSNTPLWIPQLLISVGILLLALQFLSRVIQAALGLPMEDHRLRPATSME